MPSFLLLLETTWMPPPRLQRFENQDGGVGGGVKDVPAVRNEDAAVVGTSENCVVAVPSEENSSQKYPQVGILRCLGRS